MTAKPPTLAWRCSASSGSSEAAAEGTHRQHSAHSAHARADMAIDGLRDRPGAQRGAN